MKDTGFHEYVMNEVFRDQEGVISWPMFGGWGIYRDSFFFALIADGRLYFKVDESNKGDFEKRGSEPFVYQMPNGKKTTMSYYKLPAEISENPDEIAKWLEKSVEVAKKSKKKKTSGSY